MSGAERFSIRRFRPGDEPELARICLLTGEAGGDATGLYDDDRLLSYAHVLPYLALQPEHAWVVDAGAHLVGYVVGTPDTRAFVARYEREWLPVLRVQGWRPPLGAPETLSLTEKLVLFAFSPVHMLIDVPEVDDYPAHLHIDLLPEAQGHGLGRRLMRTQLRAFAAAGAERMHLSLNPANTNAREFYAHLGFAPLPSARGGATPLGIRTDAAI